MGVAIENNATRKSKVRSYLGKKEFSNLCSKSCFGARKEEVHFWKATNNDLNHIMFPEGHRQAIEKIHGNRLAWLRRSK